MHADVSAPSCTNPVSGSTSARAAEHDALFEISTQINARSLNILKLVRAQSSAAIVIENAAANLLLLRRVLTGLNGNNVEIEFPQNCEFAEISPLDAAGLAYRATSSLVYALATGCYAGGPADEAWFKMCQLINACGRDCKCAVLALPHAKRPPRYAHDNAHCTSLGQFEEFDLYFCLESNRYPALIARFADESSKYLSTRLCDCDAPVFTEARKRAKELGLF